MCDTIIGQWVDHQSSFECCISESLFIFNFLPLNLFIALILSQFIALIILNVSI